MKDTLFIRSPSLIKIQHFRVLSSDERANISDM